MAKTSQTPEIDGLETMVAAKTNAVQHQVMNSLDEHDT